MYKMVNGKKTTLTSEEENKYNTRVKEWEDTKSQRQLKQIKQIRLEKLLETDFWVLRGDITDEQKLYRKNLRDIPVNYDSSKYDELLTTETDKTKDNFGELTHSIWSKP